MSWLFAVWADVIFCGNHPHRYRLASRLVRRVFGTVLFLLAGCATNPALELPTYDAMAPQMPGVAVLALPGGLSDCARVSCEPVPVASLREALLATERFEKVGALAEEAEYVLAVAAVASRRAVKVQAQLYWFDQRVNTFSLDFADGSAHDRADRVAAYLIKRFQDEHTFAAATLHAALQSSRYEDDLRAASSIGEFGYVGMQVLHNPMHGASMRYVHHGYENVHADVFVYPIPHPVYVAGERLDDELRVLERDFRQLEARGWWRALTLEPAREEVLPTPDSGRVLILDGEFRTDNDLIATSAYVFRRGDKYVKVRASYPRFTPVRDDVEVFVKILPESLETPDESAFMAGLRKRWSETGFQPN